MTAERKKTRRGAVAGMVLALIMMFAIATPASANVIKWDTKTCTAPAPFPSVQWKTKGTNTWVKPPGVSTYTTYSGTTTTWRTGANPGAGNGGSWWVEATTDIDTAYTKALCRNFV